MNNLTSPSGVIPIAGGMHGITRGRGESEPASAITTAFFWEADPANLIVGPSVL